MTNQNCSNCDYCIQYFTEDSYPEFGCDKNLNIRLDGMCFPSRDKGCEQWKLIESDKWKLR